jgi:hypothetical protein
MPQPDRDWRPLRTGTGDWDPINARGDEYSPAALAAAASAKAAEDALNAYIARTQYALKTVTETVNNTTTYQDDDELFFPVHATEVWDVEGAIRYSSNAVPDIKFQFSVPGASPSGTGLVHRLVAGATTNQEDVIDDIPSLGGFTSGGTGAATLAVHVRMLITVGDADGNIQLQWAQANLQASNTDVLLGSFIIGRRVA